MQQHRGTIARLQLIRRLNEARLERLVDPAAPEDLATHVTARPRGQQ